MNLIGFEPEQNDLNFHFKIYTQLGTFFAVHVNLTKCNFK